MFYVDWFAWILTGTQYNIVTYKFSIFVIPHKSLVSTWNTVRQNKKIVGCITGRCFRTSGSAHSKPALCTNTSSRIRLCPCTDETWNYYTAMCHYSTVRCDTKSPAYMTPLHKLKKLSGFKLTKENPKVNNVSQRWLSIPEGHLDESYIVSNLPKYIWQSDIQCISGERNLHVQYWLMYEVKPPLWNVFIRKLTHGTASPCLLFSSVGWMLMVEPGQLRWCCRRIQL